jgi:PAS domain S-box-containing protein
MSLILFSMVMLTSIFTLIFGFWWDSSAPFKVHLAILITILASAVTAFMVISVYPRLQRRLQLHTPNKLDSVAWGQDISTKLSSPAAVIDGFNIKFANNAFLKELGLAGMQEFISDMPITNLVHPSNHEDLQQFLSKADADNNQTLALRMLYVDGTTIPVHLSLSPLNREQQPDMSLLQFSLTASRPETDIREPSQYQLLLDRIDQIVFQVNVDLALIFVNQAWQRLLDYSDADTLEKSLFDFIHPEDLPLAEARLARLSQGKRQQTQFELRLIAKNGTSQWCEMRAATTSSLKGERSSVIGTLTDISRMKQASAGLKANARTSTEMIMSRIPAMVYRCKNDRNWSLEYVSNGCLEVTEYQPYEMVRTPSTSYLSLVHPDDQLPSWEYVQRQIAKQQSFQMVYRLITRSGKTKWVLEQGRGVFSGSDELLSLEGVIMDLQCDDHSLLQQGLGDMLRPVER